MRIGVFGVGYVGLVTGLCFAEMGNDVVFVDVDPLKIDRLKQGISPIFEKNMEEVLHRNNKNQRIQFTTNPAEALHQSEIVFIATGTPSDKDTSADLSSVLQVAESIAQLATQSLSVVVKSTVPVGTCEVVEKKITEILKQRNQHFQIPVLSNPEFLREGSAIEDCLKPDRVIIGVSEAQHAEPLKKLYKDFTKSADQILILDRRSSEMAKYAANAFLAMKISFMNELSTLCEKAGANIDDIRKGIGSDPRIGLQFLNAGIGYGGSCLSKDIKALLQTAKDYDENLSLIAATEAINNKQLTKTIRKARELLKATPTEKKKICIWGVAFKPETDDVRYAPAMTIIKTFCDEGFEVTVFDPIAKNNALKELGDLKNLKFHDDPYEALKNADLLMIITEWKQFKNPDFQKIKSQMRTSQILDARNVYDPHAIRQLGFNYASIGRA